MESGSQAVVFLLFLERNSVSNTNNKIDTFFLNFCNVQ
ncbi:hypothetical protein SAMN06264346_11586 [Chryseobacterium profundimaris]|uniref:Uncharacterized protein n=1 Tax=Chryseobacterium profundimaris TaxID=1387275 RepID=A0ABY1PFS1_9FLAO|nr:hypothetical protein SAMN06264346_11586 [Chryseobacterium profundimaris]